MLRWRRPRDGAPVRRGGRAHRSARTRSRWRPCHRAAKHAARAFTDALRSELIHDEIDVHPTMMQLLAVNTPQFGWSENKLGLEAQPVPPIFQPELAADAIHFAAHHRRREVLLGTSTIKAILGQKLIPGLLDRYLAAKGYDGQTTGAPLRRPRASNLFDPVPGDHGAHGDFELRARDRDLLARVGVWLGSAGVHAVAAAFGVGVVVGASALIARARR